MLDNNSNEQVKCWLHDFFKYSKKMEDGMTKCSHPADRNQTGSG